MRKKIKVKKTFDCPYKGLPYSEVPGYMTGYGCPVCRAIGSTHIGMNKLMTRAQWEEKVGHGKA